MAEWAPEKKHYKQRHGRKDEMTPHDIRHDSHLKWIVRCLSCSWLGKTGELIAKDVLRCQSCDSERVALVRPFGSDVSDIADRLREDHYCGDDGCNWDDVMREAADEIERLRSLLNWAQIGREMDEAQLLPSRHNRK
jgi:hypothetical protein